MNTEIKTVTQNNSILTIAIKPQPKIFKNIIKTWRWWRRKHRIVSLIWNESRDSSGEKCFLAVFINEKGVQYMNQFAAEKHLEMKIQIPKIYQIHRPITYQGHCSKCKRFHIEDNDTLISLIGEKSDINAQTITLPEKEEYVKYSPCSSKECEGTVKKTLHIR